MTERTQFWEDRPASESQAVAVLENKLHDKVSGDEFDRYMAESASMTENLANWGANVEGGVGEVDRRARIVAGMLGLELNEEDKCREVVEAIEKIEWDNESPSENVIKFFDAIRDREGLEAVIDLVDKVSLGDRKMTDKVLITKLDSAGYPSEVDLGGVKLVIAVFRKLDGNGEISSENLAKLSDSFNKRTLYWEFSQAGVKASEVRGSDYKKWDPSPVAVEKLDKFVSDVLMYQGQ